jgi:hypothetical protein
MSAVEHIYETTYLASPEVNDTYCYESATGLEVNASHGVDEGTYCASIGIATIQTAILATLVFAGTDNVTNDLDGAIIRLKSGRLILENAQPSSALC